jgi:acyl-coenzyme A synthetase/AMP-(fatty) acid ligase
MYFGASKVGVVPVPLNYRLAPREWLYIVNDSASRVLMAQSDFVEGVEQIRDELAIERFIALGGDAGDGWSDRAGWLSDNDMNPNVPVAANDQLYQMYTSGTTGLPKGAMLSQHAVDNNIHQVSFTLESSSSDRCLVVAPMYHAAAGICVMTMAAQGCTIVVHEEFDPGAVVRALSEDGITLAGRHRNSERTLGRRGARLPPAQAWRIGHCGRDHRVLPGPARRLQDTAADRGDRPDPAQRQRQGAEEGPARALLEGCAAAGRLTRFQTRSQTWPCSHAPIAATATV